jgi:Spy/CpxP family protein refolding chaperone
MKKVIIAFAIIAISSSSAFSQTATTAPATTTTAAATDDHAVSSAKKIQQELGLTDDQYNQILAVNTECDKRRDALKASGQTGHESFKPIMDYRNQQYATILTADQATKLKDIEAQRKASHSQSNSGE